MVKLTTEIFIHTTLFGETPNQFVFLLWNVYIAGNPGLWCHRSDSNQPLPVESKPSTSLLIITSQSPFCKPDLSGGNFFL